METKLISQDEREPLKMGVVYKKIVGCYFVRTEQKIVPCTLTSRIKKDLAKPTEQPASKRQAVKPIKTLGHTDPVTIGDVVRYIDTQDGAGSIVEILPRRNKISRRTAVPMPTAHAFEQVIVANVDQVVPVFAMANPSPRWKLLDRYLALSESHSLPALICITKNDLAQPMADGVMDEIGAMLAIYRRIGYPVVITSAVTGEGIQALKKALQDRVSVLLGKSGVGKTALLNALQSGLGLRVREVSRVSGKGKHSTTHLEMFPLDFGGAVVDTPGVQEFGLWDVSAEDLAFWYPEMRPFIGKCKFGLDCQHDEEPGCAVRKAVMAGQIDPHRYQSYVRLKAEVSFK